MLGVGLRWHFWTEAFQPILPRYAASKAHPRESSSAITYFGVTKTRLGQKPAATDKKQQQKSTATAKNGHRQGVIKTLLRLIETLLGAAQGAGKAFLC